MKAKQETLVKVKVENEEEKLERYFGGYELTTRSGYRLDEVISSLQKEIRRGNELMATYWAFELNDSGFWRYLFRRLTVISGEDLGLANIQGLILVSSTYTSLLLQNAKQKIVQVDNNIIGLVVSYLARSPKSRHIDYLGGVILKRKEKGWKPQIPGYAKDQHTSIGKAMGKDDNEFFREGSRIKNKKKIPGEDKIKKECLSLYRFTEKRNEQEF